MSPDVSPGLRCSTLSSELIFAAALLMSKYACSWLADTSSIIAEDLGVWHPRLSRGSTPACIPPHADMHIQLRTTVMHVPELADSLLTWPHLEFTTGTQCLSHRQRHCTFVPSLTPTQIDGWRWAQ
ncbi:hypothetical protein C8R45DRAFT_1098950 [Mycena sanguinolenta]|nr:hypothetical protein C8R45DRAFT_1098950 [Mycena sanguinolenta]